MISKWAGLGLGMGLFTIVWLGCGGSESSSPGNTTPTDGGKESSSGGDTGAPSDSGGGGKLDVKFDGNVDAPEVTLTFGTCPTFTPCGGDEKGSWKVTGGCLSDDVLADAKANCAGFTTSNEVIKAKGLFDLDGTNVVRQTQVTLKANAHIPSSCTMGQACSLVGAFAQSQLGFKKVDCATADGGDGCDCVIEDTQVQQTADTYTKDGNTITTSGGETYDYCVDGAKLTYTQTNGTKPYPLFIELGK